MFTVTIAPLSTPLTVTETVLAAVRGADRLFLQTEKHPSAAIVKRENRSYTTMDDLYDAAADFDELNARIAQRLAEAGDCVYAVTGEIGKTQLPVISETVSKQGGALCVLPGVPLWTAAFPDKAVDRWAPASLLGGELDPDAALAVTEVDSPICAGELKILLNEYYPDEWEILTASMGEDGTWKREAIPLYRLDQQAHYDATTVVYLPPVPFEQRERYGFSDLAAVIHRLRMPGGCPWDREQTHESLKITLLEECYELLDAIDEKNDAHMVEELGDVLMQVVFHGDIAASQGRFNHRDVATEIVKKMVYRHPHVFGDVHVENSQEVLVNWDKLKKAEKEQKTQTDAMLSVPRNLPSLIFSRKIQKKAADVGFDWPDAKSALFKIPEEAEELAAAMAGDGNLDEEMGDLLFAVVNVSRLLHQDPELLLRDASDKFIRRFSAMERLAIQQDRTLEQMTLAEMDQLWERVKKARIGG